MVLLLLSIHGFSQEAVVSPDSINVITQISDSLQLREVSLDSTVLQNSKQKVSQVLSDSIKNQIPIPQVDIDSTTHKKVLQTKSKLKERFDTDIPTDSTSIVNKVESLATKELNDNINVDISGIPTDSATVKSKTTSLVKRELNEKTGITVPEITLDSTTVDQLKNEAENRAEAALKNTNEFKALNGNDSELGQLTNMKEEIELKKEELQQMESKKEMKQKMAAHAKDFISKHSGQIQELQSEMSELKQKYSMVPNSNDLSSARKRSSLQGESFWKRLILGGNFNITETNPVAIDFSPVIGWRFNKLFEAGITGAYRAKFGADKTGLNSFENEEVYGYSIFANHMAFKNFFGYLEGERISKVLGTAENNKRQWNENFLVGIGRKFKITRLIEMQAIISYNFLHDNRDGVYQNPIVFKTGFRVVK